MIAILIGYEAISRFIEPVPIHFAEAIPIVCLGLAVNVASAWLLSSGAHHHGHGHPHGEHDHDDEHRVSTPAGVLVLSVSEENHPPVFRINAERGPVLATQAVSIETVRPDGARQVFVMEDRGGFLQSVEEIPEPHAFTAHEEHEHGHGHAHGAAHRDNNMRAVVIHVMADATVSVLVIVGLLLARAFGWLWMDPLAGIVGAFVIASWSWGLIRDTGAILLDMNPDRAMAERIRRAIEAEGDRVADLHVWRLGPGHLSAIISIVTRQPHEPRVYRERLARFPSLSHLTVEVQWAA